MSLIFILVLGFCLVMFPALRCALLHPVLLVRYGVVDLYWYIKRRAWNDCKTGKLVAYTGLFGRGKTLSAVHDVVGKYHRYDGKPAWCLRRKALIPQEIRVYSNVELNIPYIQFESLKQLVDAAKEKEAYDDEHGVLSKIIVLGDEFSVQLNSRNFKTNIDPLFLNTLLTCRHYGMSLYYTSQRFGHVDALLRQVTSAVVECAKVWRFQIWSEYDAWDMENASTSTLVKPLRRGCWFVKDSDYAAYDTLACVGNLRKMAEEGDMLSEEEIMLLRQSNYNVNSEAVGRPSRQLKNMRKK